MLDAIRAENGDEDPAILVNGRPVADAGDISDLPPEAIARIETLPRGAAQRVNGTAGQRAYNVVLKRQVRTAIVTASDEIATDGGWSNGAATCSSPGSRARTAPTCRYAAVIRDTFSKASGPSCRTARTPISRPWATSGPFRQLRGLARAEHARRTAGDSVALPAGQTMPTLAALLPGVNALNPSNRSDFRSLRSTSQPINLSLSGNRQLNEMFSLSFNAQMGWTENRNLTGLCAGAGHDPVQQCLLALRCAGEPLPRRSGPPAPEPCSKSNSQGISATLNGLLASGAAASTRGSTGGNRIRPTSFPARCRRCRTRPIRLAARSPR